MVAWQQGGNVRQSVNPFIDHLVILSLYLVVKVKCVIGLLELQQATSESSIKNGDINRERSSLPASF